MLEVNDVVMHVADRQLPHDKRDHGTVLGVGGDNFDSPVQGMWSATAYDTHPAVNLKKCPVIDFLGTGVERPFGSKLIYGVNCSCGTMVGKADAVSHLGADVRIAQHLESVGLLNESYTQY